jgi:uncharacterized protein (TIGR03435 family)
MRSLLFATYLLVHSIAFAQPPILAPSFEVASIRPDPGRIGSIQDDPGMLTMRGVSLKVCIEWAYNVQAFQVSGPDWLGDSRFAISARATDAANTDRLRLMLRSLLAERFGLKLHHEQRELNVYSLVTAANGPRLHDAGPKDASKFLESTTDGPNNFSEDKTGLIAERVRMADVAAQLAQPLQRPVIDKTDLAGRYDLRIDITPFLSDADADGKIDMISVIFNAFQSQLGLKLEAGKDTVDFLVIDAANKGPTEK